MRVRGGVGGSRGRGAGDGRGGGHGVRGGPWRTEEGGRSGNLLLLQIYRSHTSYASSIDLTSLSYLADGGGHALGVGLHKAVVIEPEE